MTTNDPSRWLEEALTRRQVLRGAVAGGVTLSASGLLLGCGGSDNGDGGAEEGSEPAQVKLRSGGTLRIGATGGGAEDTIDAHKPTADTDIMRVWNLYESLAVRTPDFSKLEMLLAESIEPGSTPKEWTVRLKEGITFHDGKPVTADDVIFSLRRITDPKDPKVGAASIGYIDREALQQARRPHGPHPAAVRQRRLPRRRRPVLQRHRPGRLRPEEARRHRRRSSTRASPPASRACSPRTPTTGRAASRTSTSW